MATQTVPSARRRAILDAMTAPSTPGSAGPPVVQATVEGVLNSVLIRLFKSDTLPSVNSLLADFTTADFAGYVDSTVVTWGAALDIAGDVAEVTGSVKQFTATTDLTPNTIFGYVAHKGGNLVYAERFDTPVNVIGPGDGVVVVPRFRYSGV